MDISLSSDFGFMSAASSVGSLSQEKCFYSVPTSPSRVKLSAPSGSQTEPTSPRSTNEGANSSLDEFEFDTSRRFNFSDFNLWTSQREENQQQHRNQRQRGDSLPTMAFADELFCDGKVLPLIVPPLKLPPRFQNGDGNKVSAQSSIASSPRSPGSLLGLQFSLHSLLKDDVDPFMVALEKVKGERRGKLQRKHGLRRTRSLSPFRGNGPDVPNEKEGLPKSTQQQPEPNPDEDKEWRNPKVLAEPKGLVYARHVRLVRKANNIPNELNGTKNPNGTMETNRKDSERRGFWRKKRKREKIMQFLFGSTYVGKDTVDCKGKDERAALGKPSLLRKLGLKSWESTQWDDKDKRVAEMTNMTMVSYKPRFFLCLGNGERGP